MLANRRKFRFWTGVAVAFTLLFVMWLFVGVSIHLERPAREQNVEAQSTWKSKGIRDYRISGWIAIPLVMISPFTITVKQGIVDNNSLDAINGNARHFLSVLLPLDSGHYTVDDLLDLTAAKLAKQPDAPFFEFCGGSLLPAYEVKFNREFGYPESITLTSCPRLDFGAGLMCPEVSDCASSFEITTFEQLSN